MPNINSCSFAGHLGRDVEVRYLTGGKPIATLSIGVTTGRDQYKRTDWVKLTCFGTQAEAVANYRKGDGIVATNVEYKQDTVEKDGRKVTYHGFVCGFGGVVLGYPQGQFKPKGEAEPERSPRVERGEAVASDDNLPF